MQEVVEIAKVIIYTGIAGVVIAAALYVLWVAISSLYLQNKGFVDFLVHKQAYLKYKKEKNNIYSELELMQFGNYVLSFLRNGKIGAADITGNEDLEAFKDLLVNYELEEYLEESKQAKKEFMKEMTDGVRVGRYTEKEEINNIPVKDAEEIKVD